MNDRDYLRSLGFTVGERGRFSKEMLTALASRSEQESDSLEYDMIGLPAKIGPVREHQELYGYTINGNKVGFSMCSRCADHMIWCECPNGVMAPDNVMTLDEGSETIATLHPRMVQLTTIN